MDPLSKAADQDAEIFALKSALALLALEARHYLDKGIGAQFLIFRIEEANDLLSTSLPRCPCVMGDRDPGDIPF